TAPTHLSACADSVFRPCKGDSHRAQLVDSPPHPLAALATSPRQRGGGTGGAAPAKGNAGTKENTMRPKIEWPGGKKNCATLTVAFEAFTRGGHFKKAKGLEVNLVSLSHANYGGNAGIWRILEVLERNQARATVDVNGLAVQKWPDAVKALHDAGNEIAGH